MRMVLIIFIAIRAESWGCTKLESIELKVVNNTQSYHKEATMFAPIQSKHNSTV